MKSLITEDDDVVDEQNIIVKRNELIYAHHDLSAAAQKMMAGLLSLVDSRSKTVPKFEFTITEIAELLGTSVQSVYQKIDSVTDELQQRFVNVPMMIPKEGEKYSVRKHGFSKFNWFKTCQYYPQTKKAVFVFHEDIEKYIIDITADFTKYRFRAIKRLNSKYSIRLYELLRRHYTIAHAEKSTVERYHTISLVELKTMLGTGDKFQKFSRFENAVLKVAQAELLEKTDINFTYRGLERKDAKSRTPVKNILFTIRSNVESQPALTLLDNRPVFEQLGEFFNPEAAARLCGKYSDITITDNLLYVENAEASGTDIENKAKFITYCLKYDMAKNSHALNPSTYESQHQTDFVKIVVMANWHRTTEDLRAEFREYGLSKGFLADLYAFWKSNIDDSIMDDVIWDKFCDTDTDQLTLI